MSWKNSPQPADRLSMLLPKQPLKMAQSAHTYVGGSTEQFAWLETQKRSVLAEGPPVWICGDCHAENLGPVAGIDGRIAIQIRDLEVAYLEHCRRHTLQTAIP